MVYIIFNDLYNSFVQCITVKHSKHLRYYLMQWFLTLLEVLNPTSSIHAFIEPSMRRPTKAQTEKRHKETAAANVTNMCLRPLNGGARVTIISLKPATELKGKSQMTYDQDSHKSTTEWTELPAAQISRPSDVA